MSSDDSIHHSSLKSQKPGEQVVEITEDVNHDGIIDNEDLLEALREKKDENIRDVLRYDSENGRSRAQQAISAMMTLELAYQKNVEIQDGVINVPGRVSLTLVTLFQTLLAVITFATSLIHFAVMSPNFLLTVFVVMGIQIGGLLVYHTACLSQRRVIQFLQLLWSATFTALVDWGYIDQILHQIRPDMRYGLLVVSLIAFNLLLVMTFLHFVWLGRGTRKLIVKKPKKGKQKTT